MDLPRAPSRRLRRLCSLHRVAGVELSGCGDSVVGGGDDVVGEVDQSAPGWLWQRDQLIGRDLAARGPGDAFVAGLVLLDGDLGLPLGSHADDARRSGQAWVVGRGVAEDVGDVDGGDHAEVKGLDGVGKVEAAGELIGCGPSGRPAPAVLTSVASQTQSSGQEVQDQTGGEANMRTPPS